MYDELRRRLERVDSGMGYYYPPDHPLHPNRYTDELGFLHLLAPGQLTPYGERVGAEVVDFIIGIPRRCEDAGGGSRASPHHTLADADAIHARLRESREVEVRSEEDG